MGNKVYDLVADKIIAQLEAGNVPWRKPWSSIGAPRNIYGKPYRGINTILLGLSKHRDPRWITYNKAKALGGQVRKGEKSTMVVFWKGIPIEEEDKNGNKVQKTIPYLRYFNVFNVEQIDGLDLPKVEEGTPVDVIAEAEAIVTGMPNPPSIDENGGNRAYYVPASDSIHMPPVAAFKEPEERYSTLFHELSHSTGHSSRLGRKTINESAPFGSEIYSQEELVAEFGSAFLCNMAGIVNTIDNSAAYIASWIRALKNDKKLAVIAASQGQKAADYILRVEPQKAS